MGRVKREGEREAKTGQREAEGVGRRAWGGGQSSACASCCSTKLILCASDARFATRSGSALFCPAGLSTVSSACDADCSAVVSARSALIRASHERTPVGGASSPVSTAFCTRLHREPIERARSALPPATEP